MIAPEERAPYFLIAHDQEGALRASYVDVDRVCIEGYAAGLHVQNTDWNIRINGRLIYGDGPKEWRIQPVC